MCFGREHSPLQIQLDKVVLLWCGRSLLGKGVVGRVVARLGRRGNMQRQLVCRVIMYQWTGSGTICRT